MSRKASDLALMYSLRKKNKLPVTPTDKKGRPEPLDTMGEKQVKKESLRMANGGDPEVAMRDQDGRELSGPKTDADDFVAKHAAALYDARAESKKLQSTMKHGASMADKAISAEDHRYAQGGDVEDKKDDNFTSETLSMMHPVDAGDTLIKNEEAKDEDDDSEAPTADSISSMFAAGGIVDAIMNDRKPKRSDMDLLDGTPDVEPAMARKLDTSAYHHSDDSVHGNIPADEDEELVGQILRDRKGRRQS